MIRGIMAVDDQLLFHLLPPIVVAVFGKKKGLHLRG
jgi:hypothetical protein